MTLTITVCAIWAIVWTLARFEHARLVSELSRRVASAPEDEATIAIQQLAALPEPPLETIALAATSPTREVALQAQDSISDLLRKWQHECRSSRGPSCVSARLERLAAVLDTERTALASLDPAWLERTTERMLQLANAAAPESAFEFAGHCESLLLVARGDARSPRQEVVPVANAMLNTAPLGLFAPPSRVALQSIVAHESPVVLDENDAPPLPPTFKPESKPMPRPLPQDDDAEESLDAAEPMPAVDTPSKAAPRQDIQPIDEWAALGSRALLAEWLIATGPRKSALQTELRERGFGRLRSDVVHLALSTGNSTDRVLLVHDLPGIPGVGTKAWLMLLVDDADAEVRLAAVNAMATSGDGELVECAWNVALHDHDPRIAALAERLRYRRTASR